MKLHEWLLFAVEGAVIVTGLLHIYLELNKSKKIKSVRITIWRFDRNFDVKELKNGKKQMFAVRIGVVAHWVMPLRLQSKLCISLMTMEHYICTGTCGAVSDEQKTCQDQQCPNFGNLLQLCNCTDDRHGRGTNEEEYKKLDEEEEI